MATSLCNKSVQISGQAKASVRAARPARVSAVVVRAQAADVDRRAVLGMVAGAASLFAGVSPSMAGYGDSANVFGRQTNTTGFVPYAGENFAVLLPSKWNPSKEEEFPNTVFRYQDNSDAVNNFSIMVEKSDKSDIEAYGAPEKFLEQVSYLLGKQSFAGETQSEGGFAANRVSAAALLEVITTKDKKGKSYYQYDILTRTGDGNEGGRHQLIKATVSNGNLYILKVQAGDKRWFKGTKKECIGILDSFVVA